MPVRWNLKQWLATERHIYRPSELQALLEKGQTQLSLQALSSLLNNVPNALRLSTIQALCNALNCTMSDFCEVFPDQFAEQHSSNPSGIVREQQGEYVSSIENESPAKSEIEEAIRKIVMQTLAEQGVVSRQQGPVAVPRPTISVLVPGWIWSVIPDLTRGVIEAFTESSYDLALHSLSAENPGRDGGVLIERFPTTSHGLIAIFPGPLSSQLTQLWQQGFPVVVIDDQEAQVVPWIEVDNTAGAYLATRHLLRLGHRRIAHIKGPAQYLVSYARYQGYCRALLEAGLLPEPELIFEGDFLPPSGRACINRIFSLSPEKRPTALFAASDQMAYGVLAAAESFGFSIPKDLALVGFDDDHPSAFTRPPLTTIKQPYFAMGQQAVALLFSLLNTAGPAWRKKNLKLPTEEEEQQARSHRQPIHIQLQAELVVRESCGASYRLAPSTGPTIP